MNINLILNCSVCGCVLRREQRPIENKYSDVADVLFEVEPCSDCISRANDEGEKIGYDRALADGRAEGEES